MKKLLLLLFLIPALASAQKIQIQQTNGSLKLQTLSGGATISVGGVVTLGAGGGITLDATLFNGNLDPADNTFQEIAQKLDDLTFSGTFGETSLASLVNSQTLWNGANASRTLTFALSGADDPVLTFSNGLVSLTTTGAAAGGLSLGGAAIGSNALAVAGAVQVIGTINATAFQGNGSGITALDVGNLTGGIGAGVQAWLGTPSSANFRGALTDESGTGFFLTTNGDGSSLTNVVAASIQMSGTTVIGGTVGRILGIAGGGLLAESPTTGSGNVVLSTLPTFGTGIKLPNIGTGAFNLTISVDTVMTDNRSLILTMGDATRTLTLTGSPTLGDWFDQSVKTDASPSFDVLSANTAIITDGQDIGGLSAANVTVGTLDSARLTNAVRSGPFSIGIDGAGSAIASGEKGTPVYFKEACEIIGWALEANASGSIVIDIWMEPDSYDGSGVMDNPPALADTITASAKPTLTSQRGKVSTTLTGWTTSIPAGATIIFNVDSATTITRANLTIYTLR